MIEVALLCLNYFKVLLGLCSTHLTSGVSVFLTFRINLLDYRVCVKYDDIHTETPVSLNAVPEELVLCHVNIYNVGLSFLLFDVDPYKSPIRVTSFLNWSLALPWMKFTP